jgi:hypothetical protein
MAILSWFDTNEVDQFAHALAQDIIGRMPPANGGKKVTPERLQNTRNAIIARTAAFARTHKINWYKKAHLGNTFKWALRDAGYDQGFVDAITYDVLMALSPVKKA